MKVKCIYTKLSDFDKETQSKITGGLKLKTEYPVVIKTEYVIYGIETYNNGQINLLVSLGEGFPKWLPHQLFEIVDPAIPVDWHIGFLETNEYQRIESIISYEVMILDRKHHDALLGCGESEQEEKEALNIFNEYRAMKIEKK